MIYRSLTIAAVLLAMTTAAWADEVKDGPRTGYFRKTMTVVELVGESFARELTGILEPDQELRWQLYVPHSYDPSKPAGVIVFVTHKYDWGGSLKSYNDLLEEHNLIWAGVLDAGDLRPMNERMMRAILTPPALAEEYSLDPSRMYIGGYLGGAQIASIVATSRPDTFKGGLFVADAVFWNQNVPPGIDLIRQNRFVFVTGTNDAALNTIRRTVASYRDAGVTSTKLVVMPNQRRDMPGTSYLEDAIRFLDDTVESAAKSDDE